MTARLDFFSLFFFVFFPPTSFLTHHIVKPSRDNPGTDLVPNNNNKVTLTEPGSLLRCPHAPCHFCAHLNSWTQKAERMCSRLSRWNEQNRIISSLVHACVCMCVYMCSCVCVCMYKCVLGGRVYMCGGQRSSLVSSSITFCAVCLICLFCV